MYLFYQDESEDSEWFFLGAAGIHSSSWKDLTKAIIDLKFDTFRNKLSPRKVRQVRIRSNDIRQYGTDRAVEPWALLSREEIERFVTEFYNLYQQFGVTLFFVGIEKKEHQRKYEKPRECYEYAFENMLE